jgi:hypothetical protein
MFLFWLFWAFKTETIDLVHFYDIITAENVRTGLPYTLEMTMKNFAQKHRYPFLTFKISY